MSHALNLGIERSKFTLSDYLKAVLVGNILGDVYMRRFSAKANTRLVFRQGSINAEYLLYLYSLFQHFVTTPPSISSITDKVTGKTRYNTPSLAAGKVLLLYLYRC